MSRISDFRTTPSGVAQQIFAFTEEQAAVVETAAFFEEPEVLLDLSFDVSNKDESRSAFGSSLKAPKTDGNESGGVIDESGRLTRLLVSAGSKVEVQNVISRAYKNLGDALFAAASGDEKAMQIVRKLNKLIRRANRKVRDLSNEDEVRRKQKRAEKQELEQLARQHKEELKQKLAERKRREQKYLRETDPKSGKKHHPVGKVSAVSPEARMRMLEFAQKMALSSIPSAVHTGIPGSISASGASGEETAAAEDLDS